MVQAASVAYDTMPLVLSRWRSRRARSWGESSSSVPRSSSRASATGDSAPVATSNCHKEFTPSVPPPERRNSTRSPSGETRTDRGRPRVKRCVRAASRGKEASAVMPGIVGSPP